MKTQHIDDQFTPQLPWLDLVNSQQWDGFGQLTDHLLDAAWAAGFLDYWKVRQEQLGRATLYDQLTELRDLIRRWTEKMVSGKSTGQQDLRSLNTYLKAPAYLQLCAPAGWRASACWRRSSAVGSRGLGGWRARRLPA